MIMMPISKYLEKREDNFNIFHTGTPNSFRYRHFCYVHDASIQVASLIPMWLTFLQNLELFHSRRYFSAEAKNEVLYPVGTPFGILVPSDIRWKIPLGFLARSRIDPVLTLPLNNISF